MTSTRSLLACCLVGAASLGAVGCGDSANTVRASTSSRRVTTTTPAVPHKLRDTTASMDGWTIASWAKLGGRPAEWPVDLVPPLDAARVTLAQTEGNDDLGRSTILTGRSPSRPDDVRRQLVDQFEGWKHVEGIDDPEVIGTWKRGDTHAQVTVRKDGDSGSSWGIILRGT